MIGIYHLKYYSPCGPSMWNIMSLVDTTRRISGGSSLASTNVSAFVHPHTTLATPCNGLSTEPNDMKAMVVEGARHIPPDLRGLKVPILPFICLGLVLPPQGLPQYYLESLIAEMLALLRPTACWYMEGTFLERQMHMSTIRLFCLVPTFTEAITIADAVSVALCYTCIPKERTLTSDCDTDFSAGQYRLRSGFGFRGHCISSSHQSGIDETTSKTIP